MTCPTTGKVQHATREAALVHQKVLVARNHLLGQSERSKRLEQYLCPDCGTWHVGHQQPLLVYHYTIYRYYESILEADALVPRDPKVLCEAFNEAHPLLWFSWNKRWEQSVMHDPREPERRVSPPNGRAITEWWGKGLIRWGAVPYVAKLRWDDYCTLNKKSSIERDIMSQRGYPPDWLATDQPVPLSACETFEVYYHGRWVPGVDVTDEDWLAYVEGRQDTYRAASTRLVEKTKKAGINVDPESDKLPMMMTKLAQIQPDDEAEAILIADYLSQMQMDDWERTHHPELVKEARRQVLLERLRVRTRHQKRRKRRI